MHSRKTCLVWLPIPKAVLFRTEGVVTSEEYSDTFYEQGILKF